jgi:hypothetical protein
MKKLKLFFAMLVAVLVCAAPVFAGDYGTKEEAKALCEKAAALIKEKGPEAAFAKFNSPDGGFVDRDLYVFVLDKQGVFAAHGFKPALLNKSGMEFKDPSGYQFIKAMVEVKDSAWIDYKWPSPEDPTRLADKSTYMLRSGDYVVGVGYYKN